MASFGDIEKKGLLALQAPPSRNEAEVLAELGQFGVHMAVIGLGIKVLSESNEVGRNLMIAGVALGAAGYGIRWMS